MLRPAARGRRASGAAVSSSPDVRRPTSSSAPAEQTAVSNTVENYAPGIIEVANIAYDKQVVVHYQSPSGWVDSNGAYYGPSTTSRNELWSFTMGAYPYLPQFSGEAISFAVEYTVLGTTTWDNNAVVAASSGASFSGYVIVKTLGYHKVVNLVESSDNWATWATSW
jgi:Carbohydrate/starch-binding module (family 21)